MCTSNYKSTNYIQLNSYNSLNLPQFKSQLCVLHFGLAAGFPSPYGPPPHHHHGGPPPNTHQAASAAAASAAAAAAAAAAYGPAAAARAAAGAPPYPPATYATHHPFGAYPPFSGKYTRLGPLFSSFRLSIALRSLATTFPMSPIYV